MSEQDTEKSLEREILVPCCREIRVHAIDHVNKDEEILKSTKCIKLPQSYSEKLENQCEKYISSLEDSTEDLEHSLDEGYRICAKATECCVELETYLAT